MGKVLRLAALCAACLPLCALPTLAGEPGPQIEIVTFAASGAAPVKVVRRAAPIPRPSSSGKSVEIVTFGAAPNAAVTVVRGGLVPESWRRDGAITRTRAAAGLSAGNRIETVSFADPQQLPVTIVRGMPLRAGGFELFAPATGGDLDRVAFAVDGIESQHGADLRMWRAEPSGPQGPMQVSEAAALDVGGGNRFDLQENRLLGKAYLARLYRRYGNWTDAVAAYNWGPGNLDFWINAGRPGDRLPLSVEHYVGRVLADALTASGGFSAPGANRLPELDGPL